jgi:uncharacterized membrane protein
MKSWIELGVTYLATGIECLAGMIILYSSLIAFVAYFKSMWSHSGSLAPKVEIRFSLGRSLAIALELLLGADILKTAIAPTWNEIGQLAAIAALRTALNYFLERELNKSEA